MASGDFAAGRKVNTKKCDKEITYFLLAKEFKWTPAQVDQMNTKQVKTILHMLSIYNGVKNQEIERMNKKSRR